MSATEEAPRRTELVAVSGTDTDSAIQSLAGLYAGRAWYSNRTDTEYWYRYVAVGDDALSVRRSQMHGYLRGDVATEDEIVVQWIDSGAGVIDVGRDDIRMQRGVLNMFPPERRFEFEYQNWDQRLVHMRRDLVQDVAAERYLVDGTLTFDRRRAPDEVATRHWRAAVSAALQALREEGQHSLVWHEASREVARSLLRLYDLQADPLPEGYGERKNARLRQAVDHVHAHAHEPLTIRDLAAASDLSVRALQESFQRTLEQSPMQYLREVRLRRARQELLQLDPHVASVAEVARHWGFTHMGRFSGEYLRRFGEYPRQTLRQ